MPILDCIEAERFSTVGPDPQGFDKFLDSQFVLMNSKI
jgi:hypothetical protein